MGPGAEVMTGRRASVWDAGSYSSATVLWASFSPPATRTLPVGNRLAVCVTRAIPLAPVGVQNPVKGS